MAENDLGASFWKTVVETMQEGMMVVDTEGVIVSANKALESITQYSHEELVGSSCLILQCDICELIQLSDSQFWCSLFRDGELKMKQCSLKRKDGTRITVKKNANLLYNRQGELLGSVETLTDLTELEEKDQQIEQYRRELESEDEFHGILGRSTAMRQVFQMIQNASSSDAPVILYGESGTGKELVADAIHAQSERSSKPLVKVNCSALTESLLESELFGHVKGAFTGAHSSRQGRFEAANGGYIFLDEIGDISLSVQVKLLRVLEEQVIERLGSNTRIPVDVRVLTATNKDLGQLIEQGEFRRDLYYRINVIPIHLPPLRKRKEDIPLLADSFFSRIKLKKGSAIHGISQETMQMLQNYHWPGNVRELKSAFEYAFVVCQDVVLRTEHFFPAIEEQGFSGYGQEACKENSLGDKELREKEELLTTLRQAGWNRTEAARLLGVSRVTVWNRMKKYGIRPD
ncbi:MAG: sigma 54-interacting transcriptional regulator [Desulfohalobiaceae bacterium]